VGARQRFRAAGVFSALAHYLKRGTGAKAKLLPESGDLFFRVGVDGRVLFHRNELGKVGALYDRRNNEDVVRRKLP
jgi:hypothetical protein